MKKSILWMLVVLAPFTLTSAQEIQTDRRFEPSSSVEDHVLVLKNGRKVKTSGDYEIKGSFIVFKNAKDQVVQFPQKILDMEATEEATRLFREQLAVREAMRNAQPPKPKAERTSISEIAAYVENKRDPDAPPPSVAIGGENVEEYREANPRPDNTAAAASSSSGSESRFSAKKMLQNHASYYSRYQELNKQAAELDQQIGEAEYLASALENSSAYGDNASGGTYEAMENAQKRVSDLRDQRGEITNQMKELDLEARRNGINNYKAPPRDYLAGDRQTPGREN
jgi:hypothetical protein